MISAGVMPEIEPGYQCNHPFGCDFAGVCHQEEETFLLDQKEIRNEIALDTFRARLKYPLYFWV